MPKSRGDTLFRNGGIDRIRRIFPGDADATVERPLHDSIAQEPARLAGTSLRVYSLRRAKNHHPLYREPSAGNGDWSFNGPWEVMGVVEFQQATDIDASARTEGLGRNATAKLWIARKELEDASCPDPKEGDVIEFWGNAPWKRAGRFQFWDIIKANPDGNIQDSEVFVQWEITLEARASFDPVRKTENTRI